MEAQVRYIAVRSEKPEVLARFYEEYFAMDEIGRAKEGHISLSDGHYNLSILKADETTKHLGYSHLGVAVDDLRELLVRIERYASPHTRLVSEPGTPHFGEYRIVDPNGCAVSISTSNFGIAEREDRLPSIHHIALSVPSQQAVVDFYQQVFGFRRQVSSPDPTTGEMRQAGFGVGDGVTALQMLRYPLRSALDPSVIVGLDPARTQGPHYAQYYVNHFGWLVPDVDLIVKSLPEGSVARRPGFAMVEWRGLDPDGNEFDLSQTQGYQVDEDVWVKA